MASLYISVGSNIEPERHVRAARAAIDRDLGKTTASPVYRTAAVGFDGEDFLNLVLHCETDKDVHVVDEILDDIERRNGRDRDAPRFAPRTLDLDLLLYDNLVTESGALCLPRKEITKYAFVLQPLADLAPEEIHPVNGRSYSELLRELDIGSQRCEALAFDW